mmetsp:Transcript_48739/g.127368  ORF Transcript_48739/g.127368 Transcript_48739/m.127368 type:complete len:307 (+) Transcript_48739:70-990(+)
MIALLCTKPGIRRVVQPTSARSMARASGIDPIGDDMKRYEAQTGAQVDVKFPVVVRLDGHRFSKYTRGFARPYDMRIHEAMVGTAVDLIERFQAVTAYTESDEISLVFAPHADDSPSALPFKGRVQKLVSVFAGYASARFNLHMVRASYDNADPAERALQKRVELCEAHFDARAFNVPSLDELCSYLRWRAVLDCRRNSVSMLAQAHFSHDELQGVSAATCLEMLERKGVRWDETPPFFRYGTYVKKSEYTKTAFNPVQQQSVVARRTRSEARSFALTREVAASFALAKLWPPEELSSSTHRRGPN